MRRLEVTRWMRLLDKEVAWGRQDRLRFIRARKLGCRLGVR
jgi:hypothetical protein